MLKRFFAGLFVWAFVSSAALATGAVQQFHSDAPAHPNSHTFLYYDLSGTVAGPFFPLVGLSDGAGALLGVLANPVGAGEELWNGASWDQERGNWNTTTGDAGAKTSSFAGATQTNYDARGVSIVFNVGTVTGTSPTLTAQVQISLDGGTTWVNLPGAVTATINASGQTLLQIYPGVTVAANAAVSAPLPRTWRINYTIGGTTPSFALTNVQIAYSK